MSPGDDCPPHLVRHATRAALLKLTALLRLQHDEHMQDWEIELADPDRASEFLDAYDDPALDDDDRFLLKGIIVASIDDALTSDVDARPAWSRAEGLLRRDWALHASTLWSCGDDPDPDHQFAVTPWVHPVWHDLRSSDAGADP